MSDIKLSGISEWNQPLVISLVISLALVRKWQYEINQSLYAIRQFYGAIFQNFWDSGKMKFHRWWAIAQHPCPTIVKSCSHVFTQWPIISLNPLFPSTYSPQLIYLNLFISTKKLTKNLRSLNLTINFKMDGSNEPFTQGSMHPVFGYLVFGRLVFGHLVFMHRILMLHPDQNLLCKAVARMPRSLRQLHALLELYSAIMAVKAWLLASQGWEMVNPLMVPSPRTKCWREGSAEKGLPQ